MLLDIEGDGTPNLLRFDEDKHQYLAFKLKASWKLLSNEENAGISPPSDVPFRIMYGEWTDTGIGFATAPIEGGITFRDAMRVMDINGDNLPDLYYQRSTAAATLDPRQVGHPVTMVIVNDVNRILAGVPPIARPSPAVVFVNKGNGTFETKAVEVVEDGGEEPGCPEYGTFPDGGCALMVDPLYFAGAQAVDYAQTGVDDLIVQANRNEEMAWYRVHAVAIDDKIQVAVDKIPELPTNPALFTQSISGGTVPLPGYDGAFSDVWVTSPLWSDLDSDGNLDFLVTGTPNTDFEAHLVMGRAEGAGNRLRAVVDGMGNQTRIGHARGRHTFGDGACDVSTLPENARCVRIPDAVVQSVDSLTSANQVLLHRHSCL